MWVGAGRQVLRTRTGRHGRASGKPRRVQTPDSGRLKANLCRWQRGFTGLSWGARCGDGALAQPPEPVALAQSQPLVYTNRMSGVRRVGDTLPG